MSTMCMLHVLRISTTQLANLYARAMDTSQVVFKGLCPVV